MFAFAAFMSGLSQLLPPVGNRWNVDVGWVWSSEIGLTVSWAWVVDAVSGRGGRCMRPDTYIVCTPQRTCPCPFSPPQKNRENAQRKQTHSIHTDESSRSSGMESSHTFVNLGHTVPKFSDPACWLHKIVLGVFFSEPQCFHGFKHCIVQRSGLESWLCEKR